MSVSTKRPLPLPVWERWPGMDPILLTMVLCLLGFSLVMVFSAVTGVDDSASGDLSTMSKHVFSVVLGICVVLVTGLLP